MAKVVIAVKIVLGWLLSNCLQFLSDSESNRRIEQHYFGPRAHVAPCRLHLFVDVPSNSGYYRPYLSAALALFPTVPCVRFKKDTRTSASPENLGPLREGITIQNGGEWDFTRFGNVAIVDDVYATGTIVRIVLEKLIAAGLRREAQVTVACLLRIPSVDPVLRNILPD